MRNLYLIPLCLGLVLSGVANGRDSADFRSIMPADWTLSPVDGNGSRFVSPNGDARLSLYRMSAQRESVSAHMDEVRTVQNGRITYERRAPTWIVVSGFKGDRVFYRKAMLACGKTDWHHLDFEYPAWEKTAFDQMVTRASFALSAYQNTGCR